VQRTRVPIAVVLFLAALAPPLPASAADVSHGKQLYHTFCEPCHGFPPFGGAETAANDPSKIEGAINGNVPAMEFLRLVLGKADIADVAAYLGSLSEPTTIVPAFDFSDLWWNPSESGWGLNIVQHASSQIFAVMYTYEAPNRPLWLVIPGGTWTSAMQFSGGIYRVTGPLPSAFDPAKVKVRAVGTAMLTFADKDRGVFTFTLDGATVTKNITRQPF